MDSLEWAAHGARQALRRMREDGCPVEHHGAAPSTVDQRPSRRPSTMLAVVDVDGPVGEPVAPVAAAYTSEDTGARRRGVHRVGQCVAAAHIHVDYEDPEAAEEGFYYDVAAARGAPGQSPPPPPPPPVAWSSREEYLARRLVAATTARWPESWHAIGGTVGRPSPAAPDPAWWPPVPPTPMLPPRSRSEHWRAAARALGRRLARRGAARALR